MPLPSLHALPLLSPSVPTTGLEDSLQGMALKQLVHSDPSLIEEVCSYATKLKVLSNFELQLVYSHTPMKAKTVPLVYDPTTEQVGFNLNGYALDSDLIRQPPHMAPGSVQQIFRREVYGSEDESDRAPINSNEERLCENWATLAVPEVYIVHRDSKHEVDFRTPLSRVDGERASCFGGLADMYYPVRAPVPEPDEQLNSFAFEQTPPLWVRAVDESELDVEFKKENDETPLQRDDGLEMHVYAPEVGNVQEVSFTSDNQVVSCDFEDSTPCFLWTDSDPSWYSAAGTEEFEIEKTLPAARVAHDMRLFTFGFQVRMATAASSVATAPAGAKRSRP